MGHAGLLVDTEIRTFQRIANLTAVRGETLRKRLPDRVADDQTQVPAGLIGELLNVAAYDRPALAGLGIARQLGEAAGALAGRHRRAIGRPSERAG